MTIRPCCCAPECDALECDSNILVPSGSTDYQFFRVESPEVNVVTEFCGDYAVAIGEYGYADSHGGCGTEPSCTAGSITPTGGRSHMLSRTLVCLQECEIDGETQCVCCCCGEIGEGCWGMCTGRDSEVVTGYADVNINGKIPLVVVRKKGAGDVSYKTRWSTAIVPASMGPAVDFLSCWNHWYAAGAVRNDSAGLPEPACEEWSQCQTCDPYPPFGDSQCCEDINYSNCTWYECDDAVVDKLYWGPEGPTDTPNDCDVYIGQSEFEDQHLLWLRIHPVNEVTGWIEQSSGCAPCGCDSAVEYGRQHAVHLLYGGELAGCSINYTLLMAWNRLDRLHDWSGCCSNWTTEGVVSGGFGISLEESAWTLIADPP